MFFFSSKPNKLASDNERLALAEVIKGVHRALAKTPSRLRCPNHNEKCAKLISDGYVQNARHQKGPLSYAALVPLNMRRQKNFLSKV